MEICDFCLKLQRNYKCLFSPQSLYIYVYKMHIYYISQQISCQLSQMSAAYGLNWIAKNKAFIYIFLKQRNINPFHASQKDYHKQKNFVERLSGNLQWMCLQNTLVCQNDNKCNVSINSGK